MYEDLALKTEVQDDAGKNAKFSDEFTLENIEIEIKLRLTSFTDYLKLLGSLGSIDNEWGGSDIIGGSPRKTGSGFPHKKSIRLLTNSLKINYGMLTYIQIQIADHVWTSCTGQYW